MSGTLPDEPAYGSQSGSDSGSHQDASVLYARPARRAKTRTYSEVRQQRSGAVRLLIRRGLARAECGNPDNNSTTQHRRDVQSPSQALSRFVTPSLLLLLQSLALSLRFRGISANSQPESFRSQAARIVALLIACLLSTLDETSVKPRKFLVNVEETMKLVLEREDTDGNFQVSASHLQNVRR